MNSRVEQLIDKEAPMREVLLAMPRASRARAQGMPTTITLNRIVIKRYSRRYWYVGASRLRLEDAALAAERWTEK